MNWKQHLIAIQHLDKSGKKDQGSLDMDFAASRIGSVQIASDCFEQANVLRAFLTVYEQQ